jgi:predicted permease
VSADYHAGLGVAPALGRLLSPDDNQPNASPALVISHAYWLRRFGGDRTIVGRTIAVNDVPFTCVGATSASFSGTLELGETPDLTIPLALEPAIRPGDSNLAEPWNWWLFVMARVTDGVDVEALSTHLQPVFQRAVQEGWDAMPSDIRALPEFQAPRALPRLHATSGGRGLAGYAARQRDRVTVLALVVLGILLIACGNVAGLLLARTQARQGEIAVLRALGASRARVVRHLAFEGIILAVMAAALGVLLTYLGRSSIMAWLPLGSGASALALQMDARVLLFAVFLALLTGGIVGAIPAFASTGASADMVVRASGRTAPRVRGGLRAGVTVAQVSLSFVLLTLAGLFAGTLRNLQKEELGFDVAGLILFRIDPRLSNYRGADIGALYESLVERLEAVPGVGSVTMSRHALLAGSSEQTGDGLFVHGPGGRVQEGTALLHRIRWNFTEVMKLPLVAGRALAHTDDANARNVMLVNETFVRRHFQAADPLGTRITFGTPDDEGFEIVGVVRDAKYTSQRESVPPTVYVPYPQAGFTQMAFAVRTLSDPAALAPVVRAAIGEVAPNVPIFALTTQAELASAALSTERRLAWLASAFGLVALFLTCLALYGTLSYQVSRQAREIGIRMALGAPRQMVVGSILRRTMMLVGAGLILGLCATLPAGRIVAKQLFGVAPGALDVRILAAVVLLLMALLAAFLPARRAARVDPVSVLRSE